MSAAARSTSVRTPSGLELAAWERGDPEAPPIVLMHGLTMTSLQAFAATSPILAGGFRAVGYDARGHGASDPAGGPEGYDYEALLEDLLAVMDSARVERAVVAGISMGAHTALRLCLEQPDRVVGAVAVSPAYDPRDHPGKENLAEAIALADGVRERGADGFAAATSHPAGLPRDAATLSTAEVLTRRSFERHAHPAAIADALECSLRCRPFGSFEELAAIDIPTLVVATHDDLDRRHPLALARPTRKRWTVASSSSARRAGRRSVGAGGG
ncbi:MAG TPA: alpha/beta hydrolase [Solirubrobacterales bacterium]|nr:alpha/beta hydrolase [Solirubrobacterales bacterium]